jgi:hypothetical protein
MRSVTFAAARSCGGTLFNRSVSTCTRLSGTILCPASCFAKPRGAEAGKGGSRRNVRRSGANVCETGRPALRRTCGLGHRSPEFHGRTGAAFWLQRIDAVADANDRLARPFGRVSAKVSCCAEAIGLSMSRALSRAWPGPAAGSFRRHERHSPPAAISVVDQRSSDHRPVVAARSHRWPISRDRG